MAGKQVWNAICRVSNTLCPGRYTVMLPRTGPRLQASSICELCCFFSPQVIEAQVRLLLKSVQRFVYHRVYELLWEKRCGHGKVSTHYSEDALYHLTMRCGVARSVGPDWWKYTHFLTWLRGNGELTYDEAKSHFTAWALLKSPLLIGTNVSPFVVRYDDWPLTYV